VLDDMDGLYPLARALGTSFDVKEDAFSAVFKNILTDKNILLFVAEADGLLGYIMGYVHPAFYANGLIAWVEELYVVPETRGAGIGRALMCAFETEVQPRGCKLVSLSTRRAGDFYEALGYEKSAIYYKKTFEGMSESAA